MNNDKFELHPWQVEALKEVREKLGEDTARWAGGVQLVQRSTLILTYYVKSA